VVMRRHTVCADAALQIRDLSERGVLAAGAQQIAESAAVDAAVAALVEELEGFAVVGGGLLGVSVGAVHAVFVRSRRRCVVMAKGRGLANADAVEGGVVVRGAKSERGTRAVFVLPRCRGRRGRVVAARCFPGQWRGGMRPARNVIGDAECQRPAALYSPLWVVLARGRYEGGCVSKRGCFRG
jgi:hypothetical protein